MMNLKNIISKLKENDDVTVIKTEVTKKKVRKAWLFQETFKVLDLLDRERYKRKYSPTYASALKIYKSYLEKAGSREEYDYIKQKIEDLEGLSRFDKEVNYIRIPREKMSVILSNYQKENEQALKKRTSLREEQKKIEEEIKALLVKRDKKTDEVKEVDSMIETAKFLADYIKFAKENNNLIALDQHLHDKTGFHFYSALRGDYKPYEYYEEAKEANQ